MAESSPAGKPDRPKSIEDFQGDLVEVKEVLDRAVRVIIERKPGYTLLARQAEWHVRGLLYHYERMLSLYKIIAGEVGGRALAMSNTELIVMHSPDMQNLFFEFYSLINLARITLDELVKYVRPLFVTGVHLPKSINNFVSGQSDCPLVSRLSDQPVLGYLVDIRNCIVHYRTFATSDNTTVVADEVDESSLQDIPFEEFRSVTRAYFRRLDDAKVSVNVLVPDIIFTGAGSKKKLAQPFTFAERHNLLSQSMEFLRLCTTGVVEALALLVRTDEKTYTWKKR